MIPRALLLFVLVSVVATLTGNAVAQTMTVNSTTIERRKGHSPDVGPTNINYDDCIANDFFGVKVTLNMVSGSPGLQIWAGVDPGCASQSTRPGLEELCWHVKTFSTVPEVQFNLPVRDIIPHAGETGTEADCESGRNSPFTLHFALVEGDQQLATPAPAQVNGKYDLLGPNPPTATGIGIGDTRLYPTWDASDDDPFGYRIFCEHAGAAGASGTDEACVASKLVAGEKPPKGMAANASASQLATSGEVKGLTNHQQYACAIGTVDDLQNVGTLSNIVCGEPVPITGYFKLYRESGGQAGGGFCAFGRGLNAGSASLAALGLTALFFAARRQGRRGDTR